MNISEHVEVFSSLITGLAVGDLAISLHRLLVERRKVRWDWLVLLAASLQLLSLLQSWWASFDAYGHTKTLSIAQYLPEVILLILLFLQTAAILPDKIPEEGISLRDHYWSVARYYWTTYVVFLILVFVFNGPRFTPAGTTVLGFLEQWYLNVLMLAGSMLLVISRNRRVHEVTVVILAVLVVENFLAQTIS